MGYAEWEACTAAGLDLWEWERGTYPLWFKKRVMAFVGMQRQIAAHVDDAQSDYLEKQRKKGGRR